MNTPWTWKPPGRGWKTAIPNKAWWRPVDPTYFEAYAVSWPKRLPAYDGGEWTEPELWHVLLPILAGDYAKPPHRRFGLFGERGWPMWSDSWLFILHHQPHRITSLLDETVPGNVLAREPRPKKLTQANLRARHTQRAMSNFALWLGKPWRRFKWRGYQ